MRVCGSKGHDGERVDGSAAASLSRFIPSEPGLALNIYTAAAGTPTADALKLLASWVASQEPSATDQRSSPHRPTAR
jgi:hypothetical protein